MEERLLRLPEVIRLVGYSRPTIYAKMSRGEFPRPVKLGARAVGWRARAVQAWVGERIAESEEAEVGR